MNLGDIPSNTYLVEIGEKLLIALRQMAKAFGGMQVVAEKGTAEIRRRFRTFSLLV